MSKTVHLLPPLRRSLAASMPFAALAPELREALRADAPLRRYADGQIIQQRGDAAAGFFVIEEGSVAVGQFLPQGDFRAVALLGPGDSYGELALFAARPRVVDSLSRGTSLVRHIDGARFIAMLTAHPHAAIALLGSLSEQLQEVLDLLAGLRRGSNAARMAGLLANMAGARAGAVRIAITQQELAELLGVTRATANAALRELAQRGLVERAYGAVVLPEVARAARFASGPA